MPTLYWSDSLPQGRDDREASYGAFSGADLVNAKNSIDLEVRTQAWDTLANFLDGNPVPYERSRWTPLLGEEEAKALNELADIADEEFWTAFEEEFWDPGLQDARFEQWFEEYEGNRAEARFQEEWQRARQGSRDILSDSHTWWLDGTPQGEIDDLADVFSGQSEYEKELDRLKRDFPTTYHLPFPGTQGGYYDESRDVLSRMDAKRGRGYRLEAEAAQYGWVKDQGKPKRGFFGKAGQALAAFPILTDLVLPFIFPQDVPPGYFDEMWNEDGTVKSSPYASREEFDNSEPMFPTPRECKFWPNNPFCQGVGSNLLGLLNLDLMRVEVFDDGCQRVIIFNVGYSLLTLPGKLWGKRNPECDYNGPLYPPPPPPGPPTLFEAGKLGEVSPPPYDTIQMVIARLPGRSIGLPILATSNENKIQKIVFNKLVLSASTDKTESSSNFYYAHAGPNGIETYGGDRISVTFSVIEAEVTLSRPTNGRDIVRLSGGDFSPMMGIAGGAELAELLISRYRSKEENEEGKVVLFWSPTLTSISIEEFVYAQSSHSFTFPEPDLDVDQIYFCPTFQSVWATREEQDEYNRALAEGIDIANYIYHSRAFSDSYWLNQLRGDFGPSFSVVRVCTPAASKIPPALPPIEDPPVSCCDQTKQLLAKMSKQVKEIHARYVSDNWGEENSGISVPKELFGKEDKQVTVRTWPEFFSWFVLQFDTLIGQWPIEIEIEQEKGKKPQKIEIPNLAEGVAELYGLGMAASLDSDVSVAMLLRLASEIIAIKSMEVSTSDYVRAIVDFLNFPGKEIKRDLPLQFSMGVTKGDKYERVENLNQVLKPSVMATRGYEFVGDEESTLVAALKKLLYAAAVTKAAHVRGGKGEQRDPANPQGRDLLATLGDVASVIGAGASVAGLVFNAQGQPVTLTWEEFIAQLQDPNSPLNRGWPTPDAVVRDPGGNPVRELPRNPLAPDPFTGKPAPPPKAPGKPAPPLDFPKPKEGGK